MQTPTRLRSQWFDGQSAQAQAVDLRVHAGVLQLRVVATGQVVEYKAAQVRWPERTVHWQRQVQLPDGSVLSHPQRVEWDAWWRASGGADSPVVQWQQSWRRALIALSATVLFFGAAWYYGVPWLSRVVVQMIPAAWEQRLGQTMLDELKKEQLKVSTLSATQQQQIRQRFAQMMATVQQASAQRAALHMAAPTPYTLHFYSLANFGPNAFALPGGHLVLGDEMVAKLKNQPEVVQGVLAHEMGHLVHRDGMDLAVRSSLIPAMLSVMLGDVSSWLVTVPIVLMTQSYSRDLERAADAYAAQTLALNGMSPAIMAPFFQSALATSGAAASDQTRRTPLGIAIFSSHPDDEERSRFFQTWQAPATLRQVVQH